MTHPGKEALRRMVEIAHNAIFIDVHERVRNAADVAAYVAELERECDGYKQALRVTKEQDGRTVVAVICHGLEMRIYGPNDGCERRFGEQIARWFKLLDVTSESLRAARIAELEAQVAELRSIVLHVPPGHDPERVASVLARTAPKEDGNG